MTTFRFGDEINTFENNGTWTCLGSQYHVTNYKIYLILNTEKKAKTQERTHIRPWTQNRHPISCPLSWRHNGLDSVSNHQPHECLLNRSFRRRSKKTSNLRVTGLCSGNSPETGESPAQMASNVENISIWWPRQRYNHVITASYRTADLCLLFVIRSWRALRCVAARQASCTVRGIDVVAAVVCIIRQGRYDM